MNATDLRDLLRHAATGLATEQAALDLLTAHAHWLRRDDFHHHIHLFMNDPDEQPYAAVVDWAGAIHALNTGALPCSTGERHMLRLGPASPTTQRSTSGTS
jgi:hypothetical protein